MEIDLRLAGVPRQDESPRRVDIAARHYFFRPGSQGDYLAAAAPWATNVGSVR
jgi:hypothetical protein